MNREKEMKISIRFWPKLRLRMRFHLSFTLRTKG